MGAKLIELEREEKELTKQDRELMEKIQLEEKEKLSLVRQLYKIDESYDIEQLTIDNEKLLSEIDKSILDVVNSGNFIMGQSVLDLEKTLNKYTGSKHAISCSSGTDALLLSLMALDIAPGDEVITTPFTFFATASVIMMAGAKPVFVDVEEDGFCLDPKKVKSAITKSKM